jgi:hypothetical protein
MTTKDPALIRLVTARYQEMQGLKTIVDAALPLGLGLCLILGAYASELVDASWPIVLILIPMGSWVWVKHALIARRIDAFYRERCGRVRGVIGVSAVLTHEAMLMQAVVFVPLLVRSGAPLWLRIAITLPLLVVHPFWTAIRDSPYRMHWLLPAVVGFVAAVRLVDVHTTEQAFMWQMWVSVAGALVIACAGALDHRLLLQTLGVGVHPTDSIEQVPS